MAVISPLQDSNLQKAIQSLQSDASSAVRFSPPGDLLKRLIYAKYQQQPSSQDELSEVPGAIRTASTAFLPTTVAAGAGIGAGIGALQGQSNSDILASGIQSGRQAALVAPILQAAQFINRPMLRSSVNDVGMERMKNQTLIQNIIDRFFKK